MKRKRDTFEENKPEESDESKETETGRVMKKKKQYHNPPHPGFNFPRRIRPHSNPLVDVMFDYPFHPDEVKWCEMYPGIKKEQEITILDIGCAFGGLLCSLSSNFPDKYMMGMEIREKAVQYTQGRIMKLREDNNGHYNNIWVVRNNVMKHLPNFFRKGQLEKLFFCFPDPHFKKKNYRKRIISTTLLDEYAYVLRPGGRIYTITDVNDLHEWMDQCLKKHPLFKTISSEIDSDKFIPLIKVASEDAQRCTKKNLPKYITLYERIK